jgi:phosphoglycolate phosphatase-like HAD superfamily hydrolase
VSHPVNEFVAKIGYANKSGKAEQLAAAGADAVITDMTELAAALQGRCR